MSARHLSPRVIRRALEVIDQLPAEALADLVEALINRLDAGGPDADLEPDSEDSCEADEIEPICAPGMILNHGWPMLPVAFMEARA